MGFVNRDRPAVPEITLNKDGKVPGRDDMTAFRTVLRLSGILALLVFLGPLARSSEDLGPPVGTTAPDIGTRLDQLGTPHRLPDLIGRTGLVLFFFRSADWVPYCQAQPIDVNTRLPQNETPPSHPAPP